MEGEKEDRWVGQTDKGTGREDRLEEKETT